MLELNKQATQQLSSRRHHHAMLWAQHYRPKPTQGRTAVKHCQNLAETLLQWCQV